MAISVVNLLLVDHLRFDIFYVLIVDFFHVVVEISPSIRHGHVPSESHT